MGSYQNRNRQRSRDSLDRKVDQWIQTGRQVVDGVSGNRPGGKRGERQGRTNGTNFKNVGRWVEEKIDWFFEDDDDWLDTDDMSEPIQEINQHRKRPLGAISLRSPKALPSQVNVKRNNLVDENEWPDDESFKLTNWERKDQLLETQNNDFENSRFKMNSSRRKNLPRSSRRKYS